MNKYYLSLILTCQILSQENDSQTTDSLLSVQNQEVQSLADSSKKQKQLPNIRDLNEQPEKLELDDPFFELKSSINTLTRQMDSLKQVISVYEKGKGAMPTIDEELLNLIKIPQLRHRIELQNGTIVNGEIINENQLGIIVQTSIGQLSIERDRIVEIVEDISPTAKVELINEPFINAFPDKEEITGSIKNIGSKRADFVRVIVNLWSPTTELLHQDSVFISGENQKYFTGIQSDTALEPGASSKFRLVIPINEDDDISYRTYQIRWEVYK